MDASQSRTFPGQFENLAAISEFVTYNAEAAGLDARSVFAVQLAVDEACSNIIEHAYKGERQGYIECTCLASHAGLKVVLRDHGYPFNPESVPEPDVHACLEDRTGGGLGIFLMRQLMDEVHFESIPGKGNVLTMVKYRESAP